VEGYEHDQSYGEHHGVHADDELWDQVPNEDFITDHSFIILGVYQYVNSDAEGH